MWGSVYDVELWDATEGSQRMTAHVVPVNDLVEHDVDAGGDCVCGPKTVPVEAADGGIGWLYVHNSLDGRELREGGDGA